MDEELKPGPEAKRSAQRIRSRAPVLVAIGATLLALALAIGQTIVSQRDARAQAQAGGDALLATHEVLQATLDAETGQRGFLLTQDEAYLEPYRNARQRIDAALGKLAEIIRPVETSADRASLGRLRGLVGAKVDELDETVSLTRSGQIAAALAIVKEDIGKHQMDAIRSEAGGLMARKSAARSEAFARANALERSLLPLMVVLGAMMLGLVLLALVTEQKRAAAAAEAEQADALRVANERANLLARELNHRVKNLFSVILSIVSLSARTNTPRAVLIEDIRARIRALALAHAATLGTDGDEAIDLKAAIAGTLQPYATPGTERVAIQGPQVEIPPRMVTPLGLIVHELATNAAKYGAFSAAGGTVCVSWDLGPDPEGGQLVRLRWEEAGGPAPRVLDIEPASGGFGTRMIALAVSQLGGTLDRQWPPTGAVAHFEFPVS